MGDNKLRCANVIYTAASIKVASEQSEKVGYTKAKGLANLRNLTNHNGSTHVVLIYKILCLRDILNSQLQLYRISCSRVIC